MEAGGIRTIVIVAAALITGCKSHAVKPIASVEEGVRLIESFKGAPQDFQLAVPDGMLDPVGFNMAIITDHAMNGI